MSIILDQVGLGLTRFRGRRGVWGSSPEAGVPPAAIPPLPEFRVGAVEFARTSGKAIPVLAGELGTADQSLRNGVRQAGADAGSGRLGDLTSAARRTATARARGQSAAAGAGYPEIRCGLLRPGDSGPVARLRAVGARKACAPGAVLCRVLGVSPAGSAARVRRSPAGRTQHDSILTQHIRRMHAGSRGMDGAPRVPATRRAAG